MIRGWALRGFSGDLRLGTPGTLEKLFGDTVGLGETLGDIVGTLRAYSGTLQTL